MDEESDNRYVEDQTDQREIKLDFEDDNNVGKQE